jgi:hypothetical protein
MWLAEGCIFQPYLNKGAAHDIGGAQPVHKLTGPKRGCSTRHIWLSNCEQHHKRSCNYYNHLSQETKRCCSYDAYIAAVFFIKESNRVQLMMAAGLMLMSWI